MPKTLSLKICIILNRHIMLAGITVIGGLIVNQNKKGKLNTPETY